MMARRCRPEGIFCGISMGCNVAPPLKLAARHPELPSIITMANDTGQRYFTPRCAARNKKVDVPEPSTMDPKTQRDLDRTSRLGDPHLSTRRVRLRRGPRRLEPSRSRPGEKLTTSRTPPAACRTAITSWRGCLFTRTADGGLVRERSSASGAPGLTALPHTHVHEGELMMAAGASSAW